MSSPQGDGGGASDRATEGNTSAVVDHGETIPMETEDGGPKQSGAPPNTDSEPSAASELGNHPPVVGEGATAPPVPTVNPEAPILWRKHYKVLPSKAD